MARRIHDRVMLGIVVVVLLVAIGAAAALLGLFGSEAGTTASQALAHVNAAAQERLASFETLGKLAGLVITLLSGTYAIYQKYYFAEFNMHLRLREFQQRFDRRLKESNKHIDKAVLRPSPVRGFESPIFTDERLNPVLKKMKWGKRPRADESLKAELKELEEQLDLWGVQKREYEQRKAQASLLKGAIAAARAAKKDGEESRKDNVEALKYFRDAFELGNRKDAEALEYVGHQQVRLGDHDAAIETFEALEDLVPAEGSPPPRSRALKFQAEVYECRQQPNVYQANLILIEAVGALPADAPHLERAEIHEMHGRVREKCGHQNRATESYTEAQFWYQRIVYESSSDDEDVPVAQAGLTRVREALHRIRLRALKQNEQGSGIAAVAPAPTEVGNSAEDKSSANTEAVSRDSG